MRDRDVNRRHAPLRGKPRRSAEQRDGRTPASSMSNADLTPRDRMAERLARRLFRGEESGKPLGAMTFAHRVGDFFFGVHFAGEPRQLLAVEPVTCDLRQVDTDT